MNCVRRPSYDLTMQLSMGDTLYVDWLCLKGRPRSSYTIVNVEGNDFWYFRVGVNKVLKTTVDSINFAARMGDVAVSVLKTSQHVGRA